MLKSNLLFATALIAYCDAFTIRAFSKDFFDGVETGLNLIDNDEFLDFSCTLPEPTLVV